MHRFSLIVALSLVACAPAPPKPVASLSVPASAPASAPVASAPPATFKPIEHPSEQPIVATQDPEHLYIRYKRTYSKKFLDGYTVRLHVEQFLGQKSEEGDILQANGKWVLFDPLDPADRIIRDTPLQDVRSIMPQMEAMDAAWRQSADKRCVVDEDGQRWCKADADEPAPAPAPKPKARHQSTTTTNTTGTIIFLGGGGGTGQVTGTFQ